MGGERGEGGPCLGEDVLAIEGVKVDAVAQVRHAQQAQLEHLAQEVCYDGSAGPVQVLRGRAKSLRQWPKVHGVVTAAACRATLWHSDQPALHDRVQACSILSRKFAASLLLLTPLLLTSEHACEAARFTQCFEDLCTDYVTVPIYGKSREPFCHVLPRFVTEFWLVRGHRPQEEKRRVGRSTPERMGDVKAEKADVSDWRLGDSRPERRRTPPGVTLMGLAPLADPLAAGLLGGEPEADGSSRSSLAPAQPGAVRNQWRTNKELNRCASPSCTSLRPRTACSGQFFPCLGDQSVML